MSHTASGSEDFQDALVLMTTILLTHGMEYLRLTQDSEDSNDTRSVLRTSNELLQRKMNQLKVNANRLQREISLLQRHIGTLKYPAFEIWEANILTRLIEVAHGHQLSKLSHSQASGQAYVNASRQIHEGTLRQLGLGPKYGKALLRYHEIAQYRSRDPSQTESQFAQWLVRQEDRPEKYAFWAKLFPVCYGRTVEQSAAL